ncbi:MAG: hypothetical protein KAQ68_02820, partial [Clostridiales bacterium]|nr:hypothetical protein [Clostridiales bacterium]
MNIVKKLMILTLAVVICMSLFWGCNKKEDEDIFGLNNTSKPTLAPIVTPIPEGAGEIIVAMPKEITSTNPYLVNERDLVSLYGLIFEPLIEFDELGEAIPILAQTWELDETGKKWTITIRE